MITVEDSNGKNVYNSKKMTKEEQEELTKKVNAETKRINDEVQRQQQQFQLQVQQLQEQMQKTFGNGFPFGNAGFPDPPIFAPNFPFNYPIYNNPYYPYPTHTNAQAQPYYNPYPFNTQAQAQSPFARRNQHDYYNYDNNNNDDV